MQEKACINHEKSAVLYAGAFAGRSDVPGGSHKRDLSLTGRVVVANLGLLAGLNYLACVFPISFVTAFLAKLVGGAEGHMASLFSKFWISFALRTVIPWRGASPWSTDHPWHYQKAEFICGQPWCLLHWAAQSGETLPRPPGVEGAALLWSQQIPALAGGSGTSSGQGAALPSRHKPHSPVSCRMRGQGDGGARPVVVSCRGMILEESRTGGLLKGERA
ncbi:uncharacterized [Tachysurus ichikawai]